MANLTEEIISHKIADIVPPMRCIHFTIYRQASPVGKLQPEMVKVLQGVNFFIKQKQDIWDAGFGCFFKRCFVSDQKWKKESLYHARVLMLHHGRILGRVVRPK